MYVIIGAAIFYFIILLISHRNLLSILKSAMYSRFRELSGSQYVPSVSILVPSYNEELTIVESVRSLLSLHFPEYEVLVINDGSTDGTLQVLIEEFGLKPCPLTDNPGLLSARQVRCAYRSPQYPKLLVLDKENGGKADALNAGINFSRYPLVATIDADSVLEKDALIRLVKVYMENPEEHVAVGGNVRVANGCAIENGVVKAARVSNRLLPAIQCVEYLKAFLAGRIGWSAMNGLLIISGAFGLFRKDCLIQVGGYEEGCPGEDMNIVMKLHRYMLDRGKPYKIVFCPDAVCWTQAPDSLRVLGSQRRRWMRGTLWNIGAFRSMLFIPKYKVLGFLSIPYTIVFETLTPYLRLTGFLSLVCYVLLDMTAWPILLLFFLVNVLISFVFTCGALLMEEMAFRRYESSRDLIKILACSLFVSFGYDQLNALWKMAGHVDFIRKNNSWGNMVRRSWNEETAGASSANSKVPSAEASAV
jgi:cellulose synthase/poly-beta-1,6-N-acetylglucosamine synthase-like glycosyltransferase